MSRVFVVLTFAGAVLSWGASASAQSIPSAPMGAPGGRSGPGGAAPGKLFTIEFTERALYDSDVARGNNNLAAVRGVRKDDILYSPSAKATFELPLARQEIYLNARAGYDFYQYNKVLQRENIDVQGGVASQFGPCNGNLMGAWSRHQSDLADLVAAVTKNTQDQTSAGIQLGCGVYAGVGATLSYQYSKTTNSAPTGVVDADVNSVSVGVNYGNRFLGAVGLTGGYSEVHYGNPAAATPGLPLLTATGFKTTSANFTYSRPIGQRLDAALELGYSSVESDSSAAAATSGQTSQKFTGLTGIGVLNYRVTPRLKTSLSYQRAATPTIQQGSSYAIQESVTIDARYQMSPRLQTSLGAHWGKRSFRGQVVVAPNLITNDETRSIYGAVQMTIGRHASIAVDARQETRNTNLTLFNYSAYRVGVTATQTF